MSSLRNLVRYNRDELREGIVYVAFWKNGKSWEAENFYLDIDNCFRAADLKRVEAILNADKSAIIVNGYYTCPFSNGDENEKASSIDFMTSHIQWRYNNHSCQLVNTYISSKKPEALEEPDDETTPTPELEIPTPEPEQPEMPETKIINSEICKKVLWKFAFCTNTNSENTVEVICKNKKQMKMNFEHVQIAVQKEVFFVVRCSAENRQRAPP